MFYGLLMLKNYDNLDVLYLTGRWHLREPQCGFYMILTLLIVAGIPAALLILVIPMIIHSAVVVYICLALGVGWGSFALVYLLTKIQNKYRWIVYDSPSECT